ncbi:uncharacterized protein A4U43_C03F21630 [Asparagus officinalis]|uniref:Uncharacterized protein n=1 Tax=Asparagus officinalis TaxID=4686 RepID=A0A5P1FBY4_ASPOF|nr:uncharacterized protein A4U43_C03F21630 [Asparagus officinalis]
MSDILIREPEALKQPDVGHYRFLDVVVIASTHSTGSRRCGRTNLSRTEAKELPSDPKRLSGLNWTIWVRIWLSKHASLSALSLGLRVLLRSAYRSLGCHEMRVLMWEVVRLMDLKRATTESGF